MKIKLALIAVGLSLCAPVFAAEDGNKGESDSMTSNGGSSQMRNIDACVRGDFNGSVKTYDYGYNGKDCTLTGDKYKGKPFPDQKFKTPFR